MSSKELSERANKYQMERDKEGAKKGFWPNLFSQAAAIAVFLSSIQCSISKEDPINPNPGLAHIKTDNSQWPVSVALGSQFEKARLKGWAFIIWKKDFLTIDHIHKNKNRITYLTKTR